MSGTLVVTALIARGAMAAITTPVFVPPTRASIWCTGLSTLHSARMHGLLIWLLDHGHLLRGQRCSRTWRWRASRTRRSTAKSGRRSGHHTTLSTGSASYAGAFVISVTSIIGKCVVQARKLPSVARRWTRRYAIRRRIDGSGRCRTSGCSTSRAGGWDDRSLNF